MIFWKTLQALEIHLVNLTAQTEGYASHYANLVLEKTFASEDDLVSENKAFGSHPDNYSNITDEPYDPYTSQLFGKKEIHSTDKLTIMSTDYARLSLKT